MGGSTDMGTGIVTILGSGGSGGVPLIGNYWGSCDPKEPKNRRTRASIFVELDDVNIVIDTGPDFYHQINRENIERIDCVLYTHAHGDHVNGMDDLRVMSLLSKEIIPIYGAADTINEIRQRFDYLFEMKNPLYQPRLTSTIIRKEDIGTKSEIIFEKAEGQSVCNFKVTPVLQQHGEITSLGYRFGDFAYSTDVSEFTPENLAKLKGIKTWVLDCGQYGQDFILVHPNFEKVLEWNEIVKAEQVVLTHLNPKSDYNSMLESLPEGYIPAYDGLKLSFEF
jgi:phosphoribosyl 1,2-cyclic phosphate phosphodiesterase